MVKRTNRGIRIITREVKFVDRSETPNSESICQDVFINQERNQRFEAIRYRPVLTVNDAISRFEGFCPAEELSETKVFGSGVVWLQS
ncbi:hypothetical protein B9Z55_028927 [Caenorhabditis nigoni]|uniref:Uncharacterized protein n=1 Tax=Caenorhabditis nigoni TaxID=1611254 RepID=A0A2G5S9C6_9PELO|nr:hypothetical protein B9Z55_028927 [Caenorhabditis nigoni]